jgi:hypothetical protein
MQIIFKIMVILTIVSSAYAQDSVGRIVGIEGTVEILTNPSDKAQGKGPHVLYDGKTYNLNKGRLGFKIENGSIVKTGKSSKAKIIYQNGDQFYVGEGTAYAINWQKNAKDNKEKTAVGVIYGSLRGVISKSGPRNGMEVKSKSAVMGVRGTDFNFNQAGTSGASSVTVLRGKVEVASAMDTTKKINVEKGFSAELANTNTKEAAPKMEMVKASKQSLVEIQQQSVVKNTEQTKDKAVLKDIEKLEKKAVETTLTDIKTYDPKMYEELKKNNVASVDQINSSSMKKVFDAAPIDKKKPFADKFGNDEEIYNKFFKVE